MESKSTFTKGQITCYSKWAAAAVRHSVPLDEILRETRSYHGEEFACAVESRVRDFI
jgi:hypothetical protein